MTDKMLLNHEKSLVEHEEALNKLRNGQQLIADEMVNVKRNVAGILEVVAELRQDQESEAEPPFSWYTYSSRDAAMKALEGLETFVNTVLVHIPGGVLPDCWRRHPYVVDMFLVLTEAYNWGWSDKAGVGTRLDFYTRYLPDVLGRAREDLANCNLRTSRHCDERRHPSVQVGLDSFNEFELSWRMDRDNPPLRAPSPVAINESRARMAQADVAELNR
jgi:hypothetical protein